MIQSALRRFLRRLGGHLTQGLAQKKDVDDLYDMVAGLLQIQSGLAGGPILKPLRVWVISPDAMAWMLADLQERTAPTIVEFGAGQSTVIFALWLKNKGAGKVISFEHDPAHADAIRRQLEACGAAEWVDLRIVPLVDYPAVGSLPACQSYALTDLPDLPIDLALVDGPPYWFGASCRYPPLNWAVSRLATHGTLYLDDTARPAERDVLHQLSAAWPDVVIDDLRAEKGLARCTRGTAIAPGTRP